MGRHVNWWGFGRHAVAALGVVVGLGVLPLVGVNPATAVVGDLFFSEYVEGSSNSKALEIYNGSGTPVDLAGGGYRVQIFFNGATTASASIALTGTVLDRDVFVLAHSSAAQAVLDRSDQRSGSVSFNGDDAIVLSKSGTTLDVIGQVGVDPGAEWGTGLTSTLDNSLRRQASVSVGDTDGSNAFDPSVEWDGFATDTFDGLGAHEAGPAADSAPTVDSTVPVEGARFVPDDQTLSVTFSEDVDTAPGAFTLACDNSDRPVTVSAGPTTYSIDPDSALPSEAGCVLTVHADRATDRDGVPNQMATDYVTSFDVAEAGPVCDHRYTPTYEIQGNGPTAAMTGAISTEGVVVGDYEGPSPRLRGFYIQDLEGDDNLATSDALFVFNAAEDEVSLGDTVRVTGNTGEFQDQTQVTAFADGVAVCDAGVDVEPTEVTLPFADAADKERYEGMLVALPQSLTVTEHFQLARFGQVLLSAGGRLAQPTNVVAPGADADALQARNDLNEILVDDALQNQNADPIAFGRNGEPLSASNTLRGGDTTTGTVGVMTYTWGGNAASPNDYRVRPVGAMGGSIDFEAVNERTSAPEPVGGDLKVASFNVLNYFNTFGNNCSGGVAGGAMECRGPDDAFEFGRQADKIVTAIQGLDADVVGVIEIENDGYGPDGALQDLVNRLNAVTGEGTYDFIDADAGTEQVDALGDDAIKVGMLYKPASVLPVGQTAALNTDSFVNGASGAPRNRPALAQTFQDPDGGRVTVVVNHLKSKGSDCVPDGDPDTGDGQGNCNQTRLDSARELATWLAGDPTSVDDSDVLIMGDLNSTAMEDPISALNDVGYQDLVSRFEGLDAYSYVFDGQWGYLDHALASGSLQSQVTGTTTWHINSDEPAALDYNTDFKSAGQVASLYAPDPYRSSDHDPVLIGLDLSVGTRVVDSWLTGDGSYTTGNGPADFTISALYTPRTTSVTGDTTLRVPRLGTVEATADWLAPDLDRAKMLFSGPATLDGQGGLTLTVRATDGGKPSRDTLRFLLRDQDGGVVYDSDTVRISQGNVVIHRA